ncbi:MAG: hypothetical protein IJC43_00815, partial [Clostridia bacterium]|nr:hypothetical protein [Clostridia bacterium]
RMISQISHGVSEHCNNAILQCAISTKEKLEKEEGRWVNKYLDVAEQTYQDMTPQECTAWLEKTKSLPAYLTAQAVSRYRNVQELVEGRLHHARVDGVLSMYDRLSDVEKLEFKQRLELR